MAHHHVTVGPLPAWLDGGRLLGPGDWTWTPTGAPDALGAWQQAEARLPREDAADVQARLRGLGFGGRPVEVRAAPRLKRPVVRAARTADARRRRDTTPGFAPRGVRLDEVGRTSLTPQPLAEALGHRAAQRFGAGARVFDAHAGAGGNAVGFASAGLTVQAWELDADRAADARHNAAVLGVGDRVTVHAGDCLAALAGEAAADLIWLDPPWGDWSRTAQPAETYRAWWDAARATGRPVWMKVPPSTAVADLPGVAAAHAWFGEAAGDHRRVKFVVAEAD